MKFSKMAMIGAAGMMTFGGTAAQASTGFNAFYAGNPCVTSMQGCVLPVSRPAPVAAPVQTTPAVVTPVAEEAGFPWLLALLGAAAIAGILFFALDDDDDDPDTTPVST